MRIVSKKETALQLAVWLGLLGLAAVLLVVMSSKAHAVSGYKYVMMKRDTWSMIRNYNAPDLNPSGGVHLESYTVILKTDYLWWPDGTRPGKVAIAKFQVCYHRNTGNGSLFQGVSVNPYYLDRTTVVNPGELIANDDGTGDNCHSYDLPAFQRSWFRMDQNPRSFAMGKVFIKFTPDQTFDFLWGGEEAKPIEPSKDPNQWDDYQWIAGDWGGANS